MRSSWRCTVRHILLLEACLLQYSTFAKADVQSSNYSSPAFEPSNNLSATYISPTASPTVASCGNPTCSIFVAPTTLTFPQRVNLVEETVTQTIIPIVYTYSNGSRFSTSSTYRQYDPSSNATWVDPTNTPLTWNTLGTILTWPTTYIAYPSPSLLIDRPDPNAAFGCYRTFVQTLVQPTIVPNFIYPVPRTDDPTPSISLVFSYIDTLPTVTVLLLGGDPRSCLRTTPSITPVETVQPPFAPVVHTTAQVLTAVGQQVTLAADPFGGSNNPPSNGPSNPPNIVNGGTSPNLGIVPNPNQNTNPTPGSGGSSGDSPNSAPGSGSNGGSGGGAGTIVDTNTGINNSGGGGGGITGISNPGTGTGSGTTGASNGSGNVGSNGSGNPQSNNGNGGSVNTNGSGIGTGGNTNANTPAGNSGNVDAGAGAGNPNQSGGSSVGSIPGNTQNSGGAGGAGTSSAAGLVVNGQTITPISSGPTPAVVVGGSILVPGSAITVSGTRISVDSTNGLVVVVGSSSAVLSTRIQSQEVAPLPTGGFIINGQVLAPGSITTNNGVVVSAGTSGVVVIASSTYTLPTASPQPTISGSTSGSGGNASRNVAVLIDYSRLLMLSAIMLLFIH